MGENYLLENNLVKAEEQFLRAMKIEPKESDPYVNLYRIYLDMDDEMKAEEISQASVKNLNSVEQKIFEQDREAAETSRRTAKGMTEYAKTAESLVQALNPADPAKADQEKIASISDQLEKIAEEMDSSSSSLIFQDGKVVDSSEIEAGKPAVIYSPISHSTRIYESLDDSYGNGKLTQYTSNGEYGYSMITGTLKNGRWDGPVKFMRYSISSGGEDPSSTNEVWIGKAENGLWSGPVTIDAAFENGTIHATGTVVFDNGYPQIESNVMPHDPSEHYLVKYEDKHQSWWLNGNPSIQYHVNWLENYAG